MLKILTDKFYYFIGQRRSNKLRRFVNSKRNKNVLFLNRKFHNIHDGQRCFILGSGPSLKNVNFKLLENEYVFTVNQFSRFKNYCDVKINYHVFSDERLFSLDKTKNEDEETLKFLEKLAVDNPTVQFFSKVSSKKFF